MGAATRLARSCASPIGSSSVRRLIELSRARADPSASSCACRAAPSALRCNSCCAASAAPTAWHACACARCCITLGSRCPICISRASSSSDACSSRCSCLSRSVSSASCLQHSSACAMEPSAALLLSCASLLARDRSTRGPRVLLSAKVENVPLKWVALCSMAASWASGPGGGASSSSSSSVYSTNSASSPSRKPSPSSARRASSSACSSLAACHASSASASASRASSSSASSTATPRPEGTAPRGNAAAMASAQRFSSTGDNACNPDICFYLANARKCHPRHHQSRVSGQSTSISLSHPRGNFESCQIEPPRSFVRHAHGRGRPAWRAAGPPGYV